MVRIDILLYVSCLGDSLNDKDPEFPVALPLKDNVGNGVLRHIKGKTFTVAPSHYSVAPISRDCRKSRWKRGSTRLPQSNRQKFESDVMYCPIR